MIINICSTYIPWYIQQKCNQVCFNYTRPAPGLDSEALSGCEWRACQSDGKSWVETGRKMGHKCRHLIMRFRFDTFIHFLHQWWSGHLMCCAAPHLHPLLSLSSSRGSEGLGAVTCWNVTTNKKHQKIKLWESPRHCKPRIARKVRGADTKVVATHGAPGRWMIHDF